MKRKPSPTLTPLPANNLLLGILPTADYERLLPPLELLSLPLGWTVYESDTRMDHAFFPIHGLVLILSVTYKWTSAHIARNGN